MALGLGVAGCQIIGAGGCDLCTTSATISGQVTGSQQPVAGALIDARSYLGACADSIASGESGVVATSSSSGVFSLRVYSLLSPAEHCVTLRVRSPRGGFWRDTIVTLIAVGFAADYPKPSRAAITTNVQLNPK